MEDVEKHPLVFEMIGGEETFEKIVEQFYSRVKQDEVLISMYPKKLDMAKTKLKLFLIKKFGGPDEYTPLRGHPRMRKRHMKFPIDIEARNRWVDHMRYALDSVGIDKDHEARPILDSYFSWMASHMINQNNLQLT